MSASTLPGAATDGFWESLTVYFVAFGDYLDKQWWGPYAVPAFTVFGAVVVYSAGLKEIGKVQKFHDQVDRLIPAGDASNKDGSDSTSSTGKTSATAGGGGGALKRVVGGPGSMGAPGSVGGKKRR